MLTNVYRNIGLFTYEMKTGYSSYHQVYFSVQTLKDRYMLSRIFLTLLKGNNILNTLLL